MPKKKKSEPPKRRGISPAKVLISLFLFFCIGIAALVLAVHLVFGERWKTFRREAETKNHEAVEREEAKARFQTQIVEAAPEITALLERARNTQTNCENLQYLMWSVRKQLTDLRKNELGRDISVNSDLLLEAAGIMHAASFDFPNGEEIAKKLSDAAHQVKDVEEVVGTSYIPSAQMIADYTEANRWAYETAQSAQNLSQRLERLLSSARAGTHIKSSIENPNLGIMADALTHGAANDRIRMQISSRLSQQVYDDTLPAYKEELLRQRAVRLDVRDRFASFLAPGYYTPDAEGADQAERSYSKGPMSFSKLRELGALEQTPAGVKRFAEIGASPLNDRPKLKIRVADTSWYRSVDFYGYAQALQAEMIQLGPTFVELHMMQQ